MRRAIAYALLLTATLAGVSCSDDDPLPTQPTAPVEIVEDVTGTLTVNGAVTHPFAVDRAGPITASLTSVSGDPPPAVSLSMGTWNGVSCVIVIANDKAQVGTATASVVGTATVTGAYCLRLVDPGTLTQATDYTVQLRHY